MEGKFDPESMTESDGMFIVSVTADESIVSTYMVSGQAYRIKAKTVTTKVELRGLTASDAKQYAKEQNYNYSDLHGVHYEDGGTFMAAPDCEGQVCKAEAQRINDADFWRVVITHVATTTSHTGNWTKTTF